MDFLDRLVDRQRGQLSGVRPELPSRFEPVDATPQPEELALKREAPRTVARRSPEPAIRHEENEPSPVRVVASPPGREPNRAHERPAPLAPSPPSPARPAEVRPLPPASRRQVEPADSGTKPRSAAPAERPAPASPPTVPPLVSLPEAPRASSSVDQVRPLPAPMLPEPAHGAVLKEVRDAADPARRRGTTVSISIGRVDIRPATPTPGREKAHVEAPVSGPRPAYLPRLSLEDYLERPNRGRS